MKIILTICILLSATLTKAQDTLNHYAHTHAPHYAFRDSDKVTPINPGKLVTLGRGAIITNGTVWNTLPCTREIHRLKAIINRQRAELKVYRKSKNHK